MLPTRIEGYGVLAGVHLAQRTVQMVWAARQRQADIGIDRTALEMRGQARVFQHVFTDEALFRHHILAQRVIDWRRRQRRRNFTEPVVDAEVQHHVTLKFVNGCVAVWNPAVQELKRTGHTVACENCLEFGNVIKTVLQNFLSVVPNVGGKLI